MAGSFASDDIVTALKAAAEPTRLRILLLLAAGELSVKDLTVILGQSQPRISRHLKLLAEAGLVERFREGSWVYFHVSDRSAGGRLALDILGLVDGSRSRHRPRPRARRGLEARARSRGADLFSRARRRLGPHPRPARRRARSRAGDRRGARARTVQAAGRPRHRHRAHPRAARRPLRARDRLRPQQCDARLCAQQPVEGQAHSRAGAPRRPLCPQPARRRRRCRRHASGAALPFGSGAGHQRGGARAGAWRPAADRRFRPA